jgi:hypothetical protein
MATTKGIRFGVKGKGMFPNTTVFVKNPCDAKTADIIVEGMAQMKELLMASGNPDAIEIASRIVAERR